MYYEEKIIDGILCWRGTPNGGFIEMSKEELTNEITSLRKECAQLKYGQPEITE